MSASPDLESSFATNRRILDFYEEVASTPLGHEREISQLAALLEIDTSTAQRIYVREFVRRFMQPARWNKALVDSFAMGKPAVLIAPRSLRLLAEGHGFKTRHLKSSLLWMLFCLGCFLKGIVSILKIFAQGVADSILKPSVSDSSVGVYLDGLVPAAAHLSESNDAPYTFFNWCKKNIDFFGNSSVFYSAFSPVRSHQAADVLFAYAPRPYFLAFTFRNFITALWDSSRQVFLAAYLAQRGQVAFLMLLSQLVLVRALNKARSPYFFHTYLTTLSGLNYRPLWTYGFERVGGRVVMVHYSTNSQPWVLKESTKNPSYSWKATDWPCHWVWDASHGVASQKLVGAPTNVEVVGPTWFEDSKSNLPQIPPWAVAVFDVVPRHPEIFRYLMLETNIYRTDAIIRFYEDCFEVLRSLNLTLIVKSKRKVVKVEDPVYRAFLSGFCKREGVLQIDSGVSPFRLLPHCVAAISVPFSSPSVIAKSLGLPSFFYDATQSLNLPAYSGSDIPVINDRANLGKALAVALNTIRKGDSAC